MTHNEQIELLANDLLKAGEKRGADEITGMDTDNMTPEKLREILVALNVLEAPEPKITVTGYLGNDKEVTQAEYVEAWTSQVDDLWKICDTVEEAQIADQIKDQVSELASKNFTRLLEKQQSRKASA